MKKFNVNADFNERFSVFFPFYLIFQNLFFYSKSNWNTSFQFVYNEERVDKAAKINFNRNRNSFLDLLVDVYTLSEAKFFVCTFTSNVGRFAYELMQSYKRKMDNSIRVKSLDNHFYAEGFNTLTKKVILDHTPTNADEIELKTGDIVLIYMTLHSEHGSSGNLWNGYMTGLNQRTYNRGKFPSYKVFEFYTKTNVTY